LILMFFFSTPPPPPRSTLFPYTTLFRSAVDRHALQAGDEAVPAEDGDEPRHPRGREPDIGPEVVVVEAQGAHVLDRLTVEAVARSEEHTSELQSRGHLVCRLLLEKKKRI